MNEYFDKISFEDIVPAEYNPRILDDEEYNKLSRSINEYGLVDPIIINLKNNKIIGGHQRYRVLYDDYKENPSKYGDLLLLKRGDVGWIFLDEELTIKSEEHEKSLNIALNKISGEWDYPKLTNLLDDLISVNFDVSLTGFDTMDLDELDSELDNIDLGDTDIEVNDVPTYRLIVEFETEEAQSDLFNKLLNEGYSVRLISEN